MRFLRLPGSLRVDSPFFAIASRVPAGRAEEGVVNRARMRELAAGALRLRAWALGVLSGADVGTPPEADAETWALFLAVERCAHPLRRSLSAAGVLERVAGPARAELDRQGVAEAMNVLAVRNEAASVARLLGRHGWQGIVLKGGAAALGGAHEVDVRDLDLLVRPEQAHPFAAELDAAGYRHESADFSPDAPNRHEMAPRTRDGSIMVDVHFALAPRLEGDAWEGAVPLATPGLLRLSPANHLWHVLAHGTLHHPERRGALRDLLVAAAGVRWCTADELREVERRFEAHPRGAVPARMLRMARALADGKADDHFRREAATAYLFDLWRLRARPAAGLLLAVGRTAFALGEGHGEYRGLWYGSHVSAIARGYAGGSRLDRVFPAAAMVGRAAWRSANLAAALPPAVWMARTARQLADGG
ncbi:MAG TPA: nucleotidyltransferase family protein [Longimicrobium sp.]|nr:nucleotidyltransferase family protein [Longimicrobium sp.]